MISLSNISKSFGGRTLFQDVSLHISGQERIGLVGSNGAGKTTLFSIILGHSEPDSGTVSLPRNASLGFLPQESAAVGEETVLELATTVSPEMVQLREILRRHEQGDPHEDLDEYHDAHHRFEELGGYHLEPRAKQILKGLSFRESDFERPVRELSGGWQMRCHLARLLVQQPQLLMLDEPTNHLDIESLEWFEQYLTTYPGAILVISHDRAFLDAVVNRIVEIRTSRFHHYSGNYSSFIEEREARLLQYEAAYKNQQREIEQLEQFINRFRAKASKASQAQSKIKQLEKMEKLAPPERLERAIRFSFPQPERCGQRVITLEGIHQSYGESKVYEGMDFSCERGERKVLVGPNGAGKSTLLKILAGAIPFQQGDRTVGHNVKVGYFSQHRLEMLHEQKTVLEEVLTAGPRIPEEDARTVLGAFRFRGDDVFKTVSVLSGGEKSRLGLVKLLMDPPNLLLMDEPTTHLDIPSIDALIHALKQYEGTLIFISHDVYFIRATATSVLHIQAGSFTHYPGDYDYYLHKTRATDARVALTTGEKLSNFQPGSVSPEKAKTEAVAPVRKTKEQKREEARQRQQRADARKVARAELERVETAIGEAEALQASLTARLQNPGTFQNSDEAVDVNRQLSETTRLLESLYSQWEAASSQTEVLEVN